MRQMFVNGVESKRRVHRVGCLTGAWVMSLLCWCLVPLAAEASIAYVQGNSNNPSSGNPVSVTYTSAQVAGDLNVVVVGWNDSTSTVTSIADSIGNTYVAAVGPTASSGNATQRIYYAKNITSASAGGNTVTVTFNTTVAYPDVRILEYSGLDTSNPFDVGIGTSGTGITQNGGSVTTTNANDLLVASNYVDDYSASAGSGYTERFITAGGELVEDETVTSTGSYSATSTQGSSGWWIMQMAAFRAASSGGDTTPPSAPTSLSPTVASVSQINLSWTASTDNVGVSGYRVESCTGASCTSFAQIGSPTSTTFSVTGLSPSTSYSFRVRATDAAGNLSAYSSIVSATTSADTTAPTAPTGLTASVVSASQINLTWTASTDNVGVTGYRVESCSGTSCMSFAQIGTSTATSYSATGLTASTAYSFRVRATDAAGNLSSYSGTASGTTSAGADTTPPTAPTSLSASATSSTQINLTWTASTDNVGVTGYRVERCSGASCTGFAQIGTPTATSYSDTGLTASMSYSYRVRATDAAGNLSSYSNTATASTSAAAASIAYVQGTYQTPDSGSSVSVTYGSAQTAGDLNVVSVGWSDSTSTVQSITDTKGNTYVAAVGPTASAGNGSLRLYYAKNIAAAAANGNTVTVTYSGTVTYPEVRILEYSGLDPSNPFDVGIGASGTSTGQNSGSITTTNANDLLVAFNYLDDSTTASGTGYTQRFITNGGDLVEDKIVTSTGSYSATSTQGGADWWVMQLAAFRATSSGGGGDTTPPTAPTGLSANVSSAAQINLSWTASTDNVGVTGYLIESCSGSSCSSFTQIGTSTTTTYSATGLTASTAYTFRVRATDAAGNLSSYSSTASGTTSSAADTTPPSTPTNLSASASSSTQITLSWTASTDNVGVTGYLIQRCQGASCTGFAQIGTSTTNSYTDTGLTASTSYSYKVEATDAAGNLSGFSSTATATTSAAPDTTPPTAPTALSASVASPTQINLSWGASTDNVGVTGYLMERCQGSGCSSFSQIGTPTATSYSDTGLTASTSYSYRVRATDAAGNLSTYSSVASATTSSGSNVYMYDPTTGRLSTITTATGTVRYFYDAAGHVTSITFGP